MTVKELFLGEITSRDQEAERFARAVEKEFQLFGIKCRIERTMICVNVYITGNFSENYKEHKLVVAFLCGYKAAIIGE